MLYTTVVIAMQLSKIFLKILDRYPYPIYPYRRYKCDRSITYYLVY